MWYIIKQLKIWWFNTNPYEAASSIQPERTRGPIPNRLFCQDKKFKKINKKLATCAISTGHHEKNVISLLKSKLKKF